MFDYNEKEAYSRRYRSTSRSSSTSYTSTSGSSCSSSSEDEKRDGKHSPQHLHPFYNATEDKQLPPLPRGKSTRRVRFVGFGLEKPLPPLPMDARLREDASWLSERVRQRELSFDEEYEAMFKMKRV